MSQSVPPMIMPVAVKVWGARACFARPELSTERVSYLVPTPSAIRGILEAIYWKPQLHWRVREIHVLKPVQHFSETRNEVAFRAGKAALKAPYVVDGVTTNRLQRHTLGLADVAYGIIAEPVPFPFAVEDMEKHVHIFNRRVEIGQAYTQPYLGSREWSAFYGKFDQAVDRAIPWTVSLGRMAFDQNFVTPGMTYRTHYNDAKPVPVYFDARVVDGVVHVPDELYEVCGGCRGTAREQPPLPG